MSRTLLRNVSSYQAQHLYQTMIPAETVKNTGTSGRHIAGFHIQLAKMVNVRTAVLDISVPASRHTAPSSGFSSLWCPSYSLLWWGIGITDAVGSQEGMFLNVLASTSSADYNCSRTIRLPGDGGGPAYHGDTGIISTLASIPWFLVGLAGITWEYVATHLESSPLDFRSQRGYRDLPVDEDAQVLRFEDED